MNIPEYLARIGYSLTPMPDIDCLRGLQRAHLLAVPFENLDIVPLHHPIELSEQALWNKIVIRKRGGFCYELNGLFAWLLRQVGFEVTYLDARVFDGKGKLGIDFDHLALLVRIPAQPGHWLTDVGFGDSFMEPLELENGGERLEGLRAYRLEEAGQGFIVWQKDYDRAWQRQYFFVLQPHSFPSEYEAACQYHQRSPESGFTRRAIISKATPDGRVSLEAERLIITSDGVRTETAVASHEQYDDLLARYFGVTLR